MWNIERHNYDYLWLQTAKRAYRTICNINISLTYLMDFRLNCGASVVFSIHFKVFYSFVFIKIKRNFAWSFQFLYNSEWRRVSLCGLAASNKLIEQVARIVFHKEITITKENHIDTLQMTHRTIHSVSAFSIEFQNTLPIHIINGNDNICHCFFHPTRPPTAHWMDIDANTVHTFVIFCGRNRCRGKKGHTLSFKKYIAKHAMKFF